MVLKQNLIINLPLKTAQVVLPGEKEDKLETTDSLAGCNATLHVKAIPMYFSYL